LRDNVQGEVECPAVEIDKLAYGVAGIVMLAGDEMSEYTPPEDSAIAVI